MGSDAGLVAFASREAMAARVADLLELAACGDGAAIAVSGGSTPIAMYETLAARKLDWRRTRLTLVDERVVAIDHPRSNEAAIRKAFAAAKGATIIGLYHGASNAAAGLADAEKAISADRKEFDAVILGMGDDGHTASWFPHAQGLKEALAGDRLVEAVTATKSAATGNEVERLTLTLKAISNARLIILMMAGEGKRVAFNRALGRGPVEEMPVRAILKARPDLWACWAP